MKNELVNDQDDQIQLEQLPFETAFTQLEDIVMTLETEEKTLEDTLELFERGQSIIRHCVGLLNRAELRIKQLTEGGLTDFDINKDG